MSTTYYSAKKITEIFGIPGQEHLLTELEDRGSIPRSIKFKCGITYKTGWATRHLPLIGEKVGFFPKFSRATSIAVFTTKGGVLKSTIALNLARSAALHNVKTCVVGLDIQGDITSSLGHEIDLDDSQTDLHQAIEKLNQVRGLADHFNKQVQLHELILPTDLPNLFLIPETPELVALNDSLNNINRREFWLKEKIIDVLKEHFELIIMDCSPNWNKLTTNALVACDALISPLECKINNFRNFRVFRHFLKEFKRDMHIDFENIFIPTRYNSNRKLSMEIMNWYQANVSGCSSIGIRESVVGEEATALNKSLIEHAPGKRPTSEFIQVLREVHRRISTTYLRQEEMPPQFIRPPVVESTREMQWP